MAQRPDDSDTRFDVTDARRRAPGNQDEDSSGTDHEDHTGAPAHTSPSTGTPHPEGASPDGMNTHGSQADDGETTRNTHKSAAEDLGASVSNRTVTVTLLVGIAMMLLVLLLPYLLNR